MEKYSIVNDPNFVYSCILNFERVKKEYKKERRFQECENIKETIVLLKTHLVTIIQAGNYTIEKKGDFVSFKKKIT